MGKKALKRASACFLGTDCANYHGEFQGGKWFYVGRRPPALKRKKNSPESDSFVDIAATIEVELTTKRRQNGVLFADHGSAATEYAPGACPTTRAPPIDRTVPDSKRACAMPALEQQLPRAAALLANRHTSIGKSTPDLKAVRGTGSDYNMRLAATTEAVGVINSVDMRDPSKAVQIHRWSPVPAARWRTWWPRSAMDL